MTARPPIIAVDPNPRLVFLVPEGTVQQQLNYLEHCLSFTSFVASCIEVHTGQPGEPPDLERGLNHLRSTLGRAVDWLIETQGPQGRLP